MDNIIRVVIAEDNTLLRCGMRALFELAGDIQVIGEATNGLEALDMADFYAPDLLILDLNMPQMNGREVIQHLRQIISPVRILVYSAEREPEGLQSLLDCEEINYLVKGGDPDKLISAVRRIAAAGEDQAAYQNHQWIYSSSVGAGFTG